MSSLWQDRHPKHSFFRQQGVENHLTCANSHPMSSNKHGICVRILVHGVFETLGQILFEGCILYDGNPQYVVEAHHAGFTSTSGNAFDLFNLADLETGFAAIHSLNQKCDKHGPLTVSVD